MSDSGASRRRLLTALGLAAAGSGVALAARPAQAFRVLPGDDYARVIESSCGATAEHRRLLDEASRALGVQLSDQQSASVLAQLKCPYCGCPLVATLDCAPTGEKDPPAEDTL